MTDERPTPAVPDDSLRAAIDAECQRLAQLLSERKVPKDARKSTRVLLREAFLATADPETPADKLNRLARRVDTALAAALGLDRWAPRLIRVPVPSVVRIGAVRRARFSAAIITRWSSRGERLDAIVDWFWERCEPGSSQSARPLTPREQAIEEFGEDMEYVWGRRGKRREW